MLKRVVCVIIIGSCIMTLFCIPVLAAPNLLNNGRPIKSLDGWSYLGSSSNLNLSYSSSSASVSVVPRVSTLYGLTLRYHDFLLQSDVKYTREVEFSIAGFTNAVVTVSIYSVDTGSVIDNFVDVISNGVHKYTRDFLCPAGQSGRYYFQIAVASSTSTISLSGGLTVRGVTVSEFSPPPPREDLNSQAPGVQSEAQQAQDDALGGKTQEEIQADIEGAVDFDFNSFDNENTGSMRLFVVNVMNSFGGEYSSLLLFSCVMGLAIFIIGRKANGG